MNPETGSFARCGKHPSQFFTGFCSTCLVERLSNFDSVESVRNPSCGVRNESAEISELVPDSQRKNGGVRVRKTLLSLFELDDLNELEKIGQLGMNFELEGKGLGDGEKSEPFGGESMKDSRISFWLHSKLLMKGLKWRSRSTSRKGQMQERCLNTGCLEDDKPNLRASRGWMDSSDPSKVSSWEKPRHSWDGSIMSKALSCSFSCLEEQQDEAATSDLQRSFGENDIGRFNNGVLDDHNSLPPDGSLGDLSKELHSEKPCQDIAVSDVCRKKSNGWGRVWDWSITSPFRDFAKRNGGRVLERSLSESWRDNHKDNSAKNFHSGIEAHRNGTPLSNGRLNRSLNGDVVAANVNLQKMREFKLSRSHSVRYSSPRNLDNGLLRFYLTPLRTSRRNPAKYRRRTSHSLARGFLGP